MAIKMGLIRFVIMTMVKALYKHTDLDDDERGVIVVIMMKIISIIVIPIRTMMLIDMLRMDEKKRGLFYIRKSEHETDSIPTVVSDDKMVQPEGWKCITFVG